MKRALSNHRLATCFAAAALIFLLAHCAEARSWSVTGRCGRTYSGSVTHYNNGGGNFGRAATYTGPGGRTYSASTSHYNSGNGNFGRTRTVNGPAGTTTRQFTQTNNGNGSYTRTRTLTEPDGETYSRSHTIY